MAPGTKRTDPDAELVKSYIDRSHEVRDQDPKKMLHWAQTATNLAERCVPATAGGEAALADLRAHAWGQFGNALRVAGRLHEAAGAFEKAQREAARGSGNQLLRAFLLCRIGSLRRSQREFEDGLRLFDEAAFIFRKEGNRQELARCLISKQITALYAGDAEGAISILREAIPLVDPDDRNLMFGAQHNLVACYLEAGRVQDALRLFPYSRRLAEEAQDEIIRLRSVWLEGKLLSELGRLGEAEGKLNQSRQGFAERQLSYEAAIISLDLTAVYVKQGRLADVQRTVMAIVPVFRKLKIGRELLASLIQLRKAMDQDQPLHVLRSLSRELALRPTPGLSG